MSITLKFSLKIVHVKDYFRPGAEWILQDEFPLGDTVRLCQNRNYEPHKYASLFNVKTRTPIYSAGRFMRDPSAGKKATEANYSYYLENCTLNFRYFFWNFSEHSKIILCLGNFLKNGKFTYHLKLRYFCIWIRKTLKINWFESFALWNPGPGCFYINSI